MRRGAVALVLLALAACRAEPRRPSPPAAPATGTPAAPTAPAAPGTPVVPAAAPAAGRPTVAAILASDAFNGRGVLVSGRCRGHTEPLAEGPAPLTRSDWQLEDGGVAIWVSGRIPPGCDPMQPSGARVQVDAVVRQDTIRTLGRELRPRRYLQSGGR